MYEPNKGATDIQCLSFQALEAIVGEQAVASHLQQVESIFFAASNTQAFGSSAERDAFKARWLGQYLINNPRETFVAISSSAGQDSPEVVGYLIGDLADPAVNPRYAAMGYLADFANQCDAYPAHLHINMHAAYRNFGIGARLVNLFVNHAAAAGVPGVHVTTNPGSRHVRFYERCGFVERGRTLWRGHGVVLLARRLS